MNRRRILASAVCFAAVHTGAWGYEADVHFGLTKWLALQAGFDDAQATALGLGNQRVDGGSMESQALLLEYACTSRNTELAAAVQRRHYPARRSVPAPAAERAVEAGGLASREGLRELVQRIKGKEGLMLLQFGAALHPLQDSWSHQGTPGAVSVAGVDCDPGLVSTTNGLAHARDLTRTGPEATLAMAGASYRSLLDYPRVQGRPRAAAKWESLVPAVREFAVLGTKSAKRAWFTGHGLKDTDFLEGVSLPDGPAPGPLAWHGQFMPTLAGSTSHQHDVPADARSFVDGLLARWLSREPVEALLVAPRTPASRQLAARLKLWRWRDHGSAAALAHVAGPLSAAQLAAVDRLTRRPEGSVQGAAPADAVYALQPVAPAAAPLVPYVLRPVRAAADGAPRMLAILRLRHAPYDTLGLVIERRGGWALVDLVATVP